MSLEDDLKARTLALISQQMANWVVEIQRQIGDHQASLVRSLDELQETVAALRREDQRGRDPGAPSPRCWPASRRRRRRRWPRGPGFDRLKASLAEIEKGIEPLRGRSRTW